MRTKLTDIVIRRAETAEELETLYRFRYAVYVEEMGRVQRYADHVRRRIEEPLDATAANLVAWEGDAVAGCLRWNGGRNSDFGEYVALYEMRRAGDCFPHGCGITTKLMVAPRFRRSTLPLLLCRAGYAHARANGLVADFMDCNPHLEMLFTKFGYRSYRGHIDHPEYGSVLPMVLLCPDLEHLRRMGSPLADLEALYPRQPVVLRRLQCCLGISDKPVSSQGAASHTNHLTTQNAA